MTQAFSWRMLEGSWIARAPIGEDIIAVMIQTVVILMVIIVRDLFRVFSGLLIPKYRSSEIIDMCTMLALHRNTSAYT